VAQKQAQPPPATPAPEPKPTEPPKPTEAELEAQRKEQEVKDRNFIDETRQRIKYATISEGDMDVILEGGEAAAAKMSELLAQQHANTILETRRGVYEDVNNYISDLEQRLGPVFTQQDELQKAAVETQFLQTYPEYGKNPNALKAARQVAEQLVTNFPEETSKMELPEFIQEVDRQTSAYLTSQVKMWNPQFAGTWREFAPPEPSAAPAGAPPATPAAPAAPAGAPPAAPTAPVAAPAPGAAPAAPAKPRPPAANSPAATPMIGDPHAKSWQKSTAQSLAD
jgi:hypothetical protein